MAYFEPCPVCQRVSRRLVDQALDFTASVGRGEYPLVCAAHLPLVFSSLSHPTMSALLDRMLEERITASDLAPGSCRLCVIEADVTITVAETASQFLCPWHGGSRSTYVEAIRRQLARIVAGEKFVEQRAIIRAALILYASVRGTSPLLKLE